MPPRRSPERRGGWTWLGADQVESITSDSIMVVTQRSPQPWRVTLDPEV